MLYVSNFVPRLLLIHPADVVWYKPSAMSLLSSVSCRRSQGGIMRLVNFNVTIIAMYETLPQLLTTGRGNLSITLSKINYNCRHKRVFETF